MKISYRLLYKCIKKIRNHENTTLQSQLDKTTKTISQITVHVFKWSFILDTDVRSNFTLVFYKL